MSKALITGAAGFIGSHLAESLLSLGWTVTGLDNFDPFYSPILKRRNIANCLSDPQFELVDADIRNAVEMKRLLSGDYDVVVHLAAKAGVQPSIKDPLAYQETNVAGTQNLLELAKQWKVPQFVFASSSSVYGINPNVPWCEDDNVLMPISPYASTKVSGELLGHVYSHLYGIRFIGLRFFTVYGPRQRPDLAIHKFASLISQGHPIPIFGDGSTRRDYTHVSDIVAGILAAMKYTESRFEIMNLGNNQPTELLALVNLLGCAMKKEPNLKFLPIQPGDVPQTWANLTKAKQKLGYQPRINMATGLNLFADWLQSNLAPGSEASAIPHPRFGT